MIFVGILHLLGFISLHGSNVAAAPSNTSQLTPSSYWLANIQRKGLSTSRQGDYNVFRNVREYGALGDGVHDDTIAINEAIADGNRCGAGCDSSTTAPALVYFPPGTYLVSKPIIQYYYTQLVGDATKLPIIKASPYFEGMAVIDSNPYYNTGPMAGSNWYTNQNNFFRQIRNFVIDLTAMPASIGTAIHWQVAQATSLQNIRFEMIKDGDDNKQQGIFMENGSGGFMADLIFNGGNMGAFFGSQQFTTRNLTFNDCKTAIYMNWNWLWYFKSLKVNNCGVGINMTNSPTNQSVGSIIVQDSRFSNTPLGISTSYSEMNNVPSTGNTLIIDNVDFPGCEIAIGDLQNQAILRGNRRITSWVQGNEYTTGSSSPSNLTSDVLNSTCLVNSTMDYRKVRGSVREATRPSTLTTLRGDFYERSKPQYESESVLSFLSIKSAGAKADGITDDTAAVQAALNTAAAQGKIAYFDHGTYKITYTIHVPTTIRITGEIWPLIVASGPNFQSTISPLPVFQVGSADTVSSNSSRSEVKQDGGVEMTDLIFQTDGPAPGAILLQWNLATPTQGKSGIWDVHFRVGGTSDSDLQSDTCMKYPNMTTTAATIERCTAAFLLLHIAPSAGNVYVENSWSWVADHDLDREGHDQINIFNSRGILVQAKQGPVWLYGTSSEHSQLYNYQVDSASDVLLAGIQSETPYMQSNPIASRFSLPQSTSNTTSRTVFNDPTFTHCNTTTCAKAWGLRIAGTAQNVLTYGAGLYSFFDNYSQDCLMTDSCQDHMVSLALVNTAKCRERENRGIALYGLSTKASVNVVSLETRGMVKGLAEGKDNKGAFCQTLALFRAA